MAKQTGQITVLKNNTVTNVEFQVRFIFTKNSGERITRDTTEKGVINFDIPDGDWNVSWFPVSGNQKVLPLRAGLQLKITSSTPATALADWIYGDNTHVADPILTQWTTVLDEMKSVRDEFRKETSFVGNGKIMKEGAGGFMTVTPPYAVDERSYYGRTGFTSGSPASWVHIRFRYGTILESHRNNTSYQLGIGHQGHIATRTNDDGNPKKDEWIFAYNEVNTTVDSNGFIKAASPIINLFSNRIEPNNHFSQEYEKEPAFEKLGVGVYKIVNTSGLAKGEYVGDRSVEIPKNINGERYFNTEWEQLEDNTVIIKRCGLII